MIIKCLCRGKCQQPDSSGLAQQRQAGQGDDRAGQPGQRDLGEGPGHLQERGPGVPPDVASQGPAFWSAPAGGGQCGGEGGQVRGGVRREGPDLMLIKCQNINNNKILIKL